MEKGRSFQEHAMTAKSSPKKKSMKYWIHKVKTVSTYPPAGTFNKDAETVARIMASKKVSPKGIGSGIRMIQYFINRSGKGLSPERRRELEKAKQILQERVRKSKQSTKQS
jgi:hypothetical protein